MLNRDNPQKKYERELEKYQQVQLTAYEKAQEEYDKTVITLSGGAIAVTFSFIDKFLGDAPIKQPIFLLLAWGSWGLSVTSCLFSYYSSVLSLRKILSKLSNEEEVSNKNPGGICASITEILNFLSGFLFLVGVFSVIYFVYCNLEK